MKSKQNKETFNKEIFQKIYEMHMKHHKEFVENISTFVDQNQKESTFNYGDTYRKLSLYENEISSLNTELQQLKKENTLLHDQLQMNQVHFSNNKEIASIKEDTQELKRLISTIKGEVHDIKKHLIGEPIKELQDDVHVDKLHTSDIFFILELTDTRIATCAGDGSISIVSLDYQTKKWKQDIKQVNAHSSSVYCLCELSNNRLVSCSGDYTIKVWSITPTTLNLLSTLTQHTSYVYKVIPLTNNRFATCSYDKKVKIWNSESSHGVITTLQHNGSVYDILRLKQKEILITSDCSEYGCNPSITFWHSNNYNKLQSINGHYATYGGTKMIELPNGLVAISSCASYPIIIVDPITYSIVKVIEEGYITKHSSLCVWDQHSFIYAYGGRVVQIAIGNNYRILFRTKGEQQLDGFNGVVHVREREYLIVQDSAKTGFKVIKPYY